MGNEVAKQEKFEISKEEIRKNICPTATDQEILMFQKKCEFLNLNPYLGEIYLVKYGGQKAQHIVNYLEYVRRAENTGQLDGYNVVIAEDKQSATITIQRKDWSIPFTKTVYREEFDKKQSTWKEKPLYMLEKVAIACGFRQCFTLSELPYTFEEVQSMKNITPVNNESKPMFTKDEQIAENEQDNEEAESVKVEVVKTCEEIIKELQDKCPEKLKGFMAKVKWDIDNLNSTQKKAIEDKPDSFIEKVKSFEV